MFTSLKKEFHASRASANFILIVAMASITQFFGYLILLVFAFTSSGGSSWGQIISTTFMIGASTVLVGFLLGFLFGIPRTSEDTSAIINEVLSKLDSSKYTTKISQKYQANTNLEQVSDWLTKILIGIGLTQFNNLRDSLGSLATKIATHLPSLQNAEPLIIASIIFFCLIGFLEGYLLARLILPSVFIGAENDLRRLQTNFANLVNLKLDLKYLKQHEKELLRNVIDKFGEGSQFFLPEDFKLRSPQHHAVESLEERYLVRSEEGEELKSGIAIGLTPIAQEILDKIKQELSE